MNEATQILFSLLILNSAVHGFSEVPTPANVSILCHNFETVAHWNYPEPSLKPRFFVTVNGYRGGAKEVEKCFNITHQHCNITHLILLSTEDSYFVTVTAAVGSNKSAGEESQEFTYNKNMVERILCTLDFPPVNLSISDGVMAVSFTHPFHIYRGALGKKKKKDVDFSYSIFTEEEGEIKESKFNCETKECRENVPVPESEVRHCVEINGRLDSFFLTASEKNCYDPRKNAGMNSTYIILFVAIGVLVAVFLAGIAMVVFRKLTRDSSSLPKMMASVISQSRIGGNTMQPESTSVSEVQVSPSGTTPLLPTAEDIAEDKPVVTGSTMPLDRSRFPIGEEGGSGGLTESCEGSGQQFSGSGEEQEHSIVSSGYDRPKFTVEISPGDHAEAYRSAQA
ncbi:interferon gamma receptor 1-like [Megalops cyprinoides]|uniref:interferon gamma receptor 1-like n=1 Tax=Megalops cyprinoides TaxID=118141 RepID=UPI001865290D|nr:interferon gamma receptor 1-like [Megalops cyprinoides]